MKTSQGELAAVLLPASALSRRRFLSAGAVTLRLAAAGALAAEPPSDPLVELVDLEVRLARWTRRQRDKILTAPPDGEGQAIPWADYGFKWPAYTLAHLWAWKHPANPLHGADWCFTLRWSCMTKRSRGGNTASLAELAASAPMKIPTMSAPTCWRRSASKSTPGGGNDGLSTKRPG